MASARMSSSAIPVSKEGRLYVVREAGTLSLRRFKCKGRYFVLRGKFAYIYKKAPKSESDARDNVRRGYMGPHVRLAEAGRIMAGGNPLYIFKIYSAIDHKKELVIGALTPEEVHMWMSALQSAIDSVGQVRVVHSTRLSVGAPVAEKPTSPRKEGRVSEPGPSPTNDLSPKRGDSSRGSAQNGVIKESESPLGKPPSMSRKHTRRKDSYGRGIPEYFKDWTESEIAHAGHGEILDAMERDSETASSMSWRLIKCENGLRFFEQIHDSDDENNTRTVKSIGIVDAPADKVFALVMSMGKLRLEWDAVFKEGKIVEEIDGHTDVIYKKLRKDWHRGVARSRDLLISRYWRRTEDGRYEILYFPARHRDFPKKFGVVRVKVVSGGFVISPIQPAPGTSSPRCIVEHVLEMKPHGVSCCCGQAGPTYRERLHYMMLNRVAGIRDLFAIRLAKPAGPSSPVASRTRSLQASEPGHTRDDSRELFVKMPSNAFEFESDDSEAASPTSRSFPFADLLEDDSDDDDDFFDATNELTEAQSAFIRQQSQRRMSGKAFPSSSHEETAEIRRHAPYSFVSDPRLIRPIYVDFSSFVGTLGRGPEENGKDSWSEPAGHLFKVRGANYLKDRQKVMAGEPICRLVATDWYKANTKMDALASRPGNRVMQAFHEANTGPDGRSKGLFMFVINMQVPGPTNYSMAFYFLCDKPIEEGSLLHRFINGDDAFRNKRFKLIPSIVKGSWVVKQSVGSTACLLGNALTMTYVRGKDNLEFEVNIGSSMVANGIMGMVVGYITHLVVDLAFLIQGDAPDELPEQLLGAVRISRLQLTSAIDPPPIEDSS